MYRAILGQIKIKKINTRIFSNPYNSPITTKFVLLREYKVRENPYLVYFTQCIFKILIIVEISDEHTLLRVELQTEYLQ